MTPLRERARHLLAAMEERRTFGVAAEMSFWLFCGLLPLALSTVAITVLFARGPATISPFFATVPPATRDLIGHELGVIAASGPPSAWSIALATWLGSSGIHAIFDGFEAQLGQTTRWRAKRARALVGCVALSLGAALLTAIWSRVGRWIGDGLAATSLSFAASAVVLYAVVAGLYFLGIPTPIRARLPRAPGTVVVVVVVGLVAVGYRTYLRAFGDGSAYQAGFAVIVVTLTALYLFSLALLLGLAVNQLLIAKSQPPLRAR